MSIRRRKKNSGTKPEDLDNRRGPKLPKRVHERVLDPTPTTRTLHVRDIRFEGPSNNKMERLNGEIRDREKVMRSLKKSDTPILPGCQIYHNYMRPHMGLNGRTPAEACGITIEGENRWMTLIQNASRRVLYESKSIV